MPFEEAISLMDWALADTSTPIFEDLQEAEFYRHTPAELAQILMVRGLIGQNEYTDALLPYNRKAHAQRIERKERESAYAHAVKLLESSIQFA